MQRLLILAALVVVAEGCATAPVLRKQSFDFKTTALFKLPCDSPEVLEAQREVSNDGLETEANQCNSVHMLRMADRFMTIQETDDARGSRGDTIQAVREKGFSIFSTSTASAESEHRPLYGNAHWRRGWGHPPPLQRPEDIKAYADYMAQHYGE